MQRPLASSLALPAVLLVAVLLRIGAALVLSPALESDGLSYVTMAHNLATTGVLSDNFGQHVFYSAGYPLVLTPAFEIAGSSMSTVLAVNLALTVITGMLLHRLVLALGAPRGAALLAVAVFAVWLPAVWNATLPAKENLSTLLLVGLLLSALAMAREKSVLLPAVAAGLYWSTGVLTGGSALLAGAAILVALGGQLADGRPGDALRSLIACAAAAALVLGPWLVATQRMVGEPMLSSNAEFNLYLGNNPAADGRFVSIADTPAGPQWEAKREALGEAGAAHWLGGMARDWIAANPGEAARLAAVKLGLFWMPNLPDSADFAARRTVSTIRLGDVAQYVLVLAAAVLALCRSSIPRRERLAVAALIGGFWLIHAAAYVMPRYRDPIAPILIALAACWAWPPLSRRFFPRTSHAA